MQYKNARNIHHRDLIKIRGRECDVDDIIQKSMIRKIDISWIENDRVILLVKKAFVYLSSLALSTYPSFA